VYSHPGSTDTEQSKIAWRYSGAVGVTAYKMPFHLVHYSLQH